MRIAFASTDGERIDDHFGTARSFLVYEIDALQYRSVETRLIELRDDDDDKIDARLERLGDCTIVSMAQIGGVAAARLTMAGIHPLRSTGEDIVSFLERFRQVLAGSPPPWLKKALVKRA